MSVVCTSFSFHLQSTTSTFQAALITDGSYSYAVFIYECGGIEWGGATIGWSETHDFIRETHSLSGRNSSDIGCTNSNSYSVVIYSLHSKCCLAPLLCDVSNPRRACTARVTVAGFVLVWRSLTASSKI